MSCVFFVGWCGSTKRIHYGCVSSSGCRFSYILDFRCVVWEMKNRRTPVPLSIQPKQIHMPDCTSLEAMSKASCLAKLHIPSANPGGEGWLMFGLSTGCQLYKQAWLSGFERPRISMQTRGQCVVIRHAASLLKDVRLVDLSLLLVVFAIQLPWATHIHAC